MTYVITNSERIGSDSSNGYTSSGKPISSPQSGVQPNSSSGGDNNSNSNSFVNTTTEQRTFAKPNPKNRPAPTALAGGVSRLNLGMSSRVFDVFSSKVPGRNTFGKDSRIFTGDGTRLTHLKGPTAFEDGTEVHY